MSRPKKYGDRVGTALRIPVDLHARLAAIANDRDTSINHLICKATEHYLDNVLEPIERRPR